MAIRLVFKLCLFTLCSGVLSLYFLHHTINYPRLYLLKNFHVTGSVLTLKENRGEGVFNISVFSALRMSNSRYANILNKLYSDEILVADIPLKTFQLRNLVLKPKGGDKISDLPDFFFNTLFFMEDYNPTTGLIYNNNQIGRRKPVKTRICISEEGYITVHKDGEKIKLKDVWQAPFVLTPLSRVKNNLKSLNYRHFISFKDGHLFYISGHNNSLICWSDIKEIMEQMGLQSVIALDGGASLHYHFKGKQNNYSYSSIPFRQYWFHRNSPFYIEGLLKP